MTIKMITPLSIKFENFFNFKEFFFEFPQDFEIFHLKGINGSGKTTILEGIPYALFGNMRFLERS